MDRLEKPPVGTPIDVSDIGSLRFEIVRIERGRSRDGCSFFVMQSPRTVEEPVEQGATLLEDTDLRLGL